VVPKSRTGGVISVSDIGGRTPRMSGQVTWMLTRR